MHVPEFRLSHRLSAWPRCSIELHCCKGVCSYSTGWLLHRCGDITFEELLPRFRCRRCHRFRPAPVYLSADRDFGSYVASWKIELVPPIRERPRLGNGDEIGQEKKPKAAHTSWSGGFP
jgi:hypothetical protein